MELNDTVDLARGLVAGWLTDQVDDRGSLPVRAGLAVGLVGLLIAVFANGWWRALGLIVLGLGLFVAVGVWVVQRLAKFAITRFAEPKSLAGQRDEIRGAIDEMDLPTSPLAIVRFLGRIRKGAGPEIARINSVIGRLGDQLG